MPRKTRNHKRRRTKRKTLKRKNKRTKRYTRKRKAGKKKKPMDLATRIQRIDGYIKATMDDLQKHKRSKSVAFPGGLLDNTYLLANIRRYPENPPVVKGMFGINKKKTAKAELMWKEALQRHKTALEEIFNETFKVEKEYVEFSKQYPYQKRYPHELGSYELTDMMLAALELTQMRLGQQGNQRQQVNQFRNNQM